MRQVCILRVDLGTLWAQKYYEPLNVLVFWVPPPNISSMDDFHMHIDTCMKCIRECFNSYDVWSSVEQHKWMVKPSDRVQQRDFIFSYLNQNQNTLSIPKEIMYDFDFIIWCLAMIFFCVCLHALALVLLYLQVNNWINVISNDLLLYITWKMFIK